MAGVLPAPLKDCIAGGLSGLTTDAIQHPILTIKNRLQTQGASGAYAYRGPTDALRTIVRTEGVRGLYKGYSAILFALGTGLGVVMLACRTPAFSLYFTGYQFIQGVGKASPTLAPLVHMGGGIFAQMSVALHDLMCGALVWVPTDVLKERMQIQTATRPGYENFWRAAATVVRADGFGALYRGYWPHQLAWGPFNAIYWAVFEQLKAYGRTNYTAGEETNLLVLTTSFTSGTAAAVITAPIDNLKVRIQTQGTPLADGSVTTVHKSILDLIRSTYRQEGVGGFMRGASARVMAAAPATMIVQTMYASIRKSLD